MKHTPKPWDQRQIFDHRRSWYDYSKVTADMGNIVICVVQSESIEQDEANARLIAAAPDYHEDAYMLALLVLQSDLYKDPDVRDAVDNVLAIHRRAEGVEP